MNYHVNKDSGFVADVSYQGESNYFTFKSNYKGPAQQQQSYQQQQPIVEQYAPASYYYQPVATEAPYYATTPQPVIVSKPSYHYQELPATPVVKKPAPRYKEHPSNKQYHKEITYDAPITTTTSKPATSSRVVGEDHKDMSKMAMYPLYRGDYYSARAKAGKPIAPGSYAVDEAGAAYIKPAASYSVPDKLGTYEINHRKATVRKPSKSDYSAPEALIVQ